MLPKLSDARETAFKQPSGKVFFQPDALRQGLPRACFCEKISDLKNLLTDWGDPISLKFRDKVLAKDNDPESVAVFFQYGAGNDDLSFRDLSYACYSTEEFKAGSTCHTTPRGFFVGGTNSSKLIWQKQLPIDPFSKMTIHIVEGKMVCVLPEKYDVLFTPQENMLQLKVIRPAAGRQFLVLPPISFTWKQLPITKAVMQSAIRSDEIEEISKQGPCSINPMDPGPSARRAKIISLHY